MTTPKRPPRVVIDTNVIVSALLFPGGTLSSLKALWQDGRLVPLVSRVTTEELLLVLQYPKFQLDVSEQNAVLAAYLPYCETLPEPKPRIKLPKCRDPEDEAFLRLAAAGKAAYLVTGDADLHAVKEQLPFKIVTPRELIQILEKGWDELMASRV